VVRPFADRAAPVKPETPVHGPLGAACFFAALWGGVGTFGELVIRRSQRRIADAAVLPQGLRQYIAGAPSW
jgi:hypothetical protein